jgi:hypothetical protein
MAGAPGRSGRPPLPLAVAIANGAITNHPERFAGRVETQEALDNMPLGMVSPEIMVDPRLVAIWSSFLRECPWLRESDRTVIEIACHCRAALYHAVQNGEAADEKTLNLLLRVLSSIGATPTTVHKVLPPKSKESEKKVKKGSRFAREFLESKAA